MARSTTIASLAAKLTLDSRRFESGMQRTRSSFRQFGGNADTAKSKARGFQSQLANIRGMNMFSGGLASMAGKLAGIVGVSLSVAGAVNKVASAFTELDKIIKTARFANALPSELQDLQLVMDFVGMSATELNSNVERMSRRLAKGAEEGSKLNDTLKPLGLTAEGLFSMGLRDRILAISSGMDRVGVRSREAGLALDELMGRSGQRMALLFAGGREELEQMLNISRDLGGALQDVSGSDVEAVIDSSRIVQERFSRIWQTIAIGIAPEVLKISDGLSGWIGKADSFNNQLGPISSAFRGIVAVVGSIGTGISVVLRSISIGINAIINAIAVMGLGLASILTYVPVIGKRFESLKNTIGAFTTLQTDAITKSGESIANDVKGAIGMWQSVLESSDTEGALSGMSEEMRKSIAQMTAEFDEALEDMENSAASSSGFNSFMEGVISSLQSEVDSLVDSLKTPIEKFGDEVGRINELFRMGAIDAGTFDRAIKRAQDTLESSMDTSAFDELQREAERVAESVKTPFEQFEDERAKLSNLLSKGFINESTFDRAIEKAQSNLSEAIGTTTDTLWEQGDAFENIIDQQKEMSRQTDALSGKAQNLAIGVGGVTGGGGEVPVNRGFETNIPTINNQTMNGRPLSQSNDGGGLSRTNSLLESIDRKIGAQQVAVLA